ncbi:hypothetical protein [uncultured Microbacterium sp.]|uniref:hypothetical protein n=1 Tax=uncultured Microbacterium sp. TaxID=191216 RepID=UPI00095BE866|nr:hypothetical protein [uncultured Microbacterium sp.]MBN9141093.1 hypothetical protein [Micrococcales bacterium]OJX69715.1 MAG: hypothetical protein BGO94_14680 [Micrococcales bacterium 72-143]
MSANGQLRDDELAYIDEHTRLAVAPARAWAAAKAAAARDEVELRATPSTICPGIAGYRDLDMQDWLIAHPTGPAPIASRGASTHGYGTVVDVDRGLTWMRKHPEYGFVFDTIRGEPWHVLIRPPAWASTGTTPITTPEEEEEMPFILMSTGRGKWLINATNAHHLTPEEDRQIIDLAASGIGPYPVKDCGTNDRAFDLIKTAHTQPS